MRCEQVEHLALGGDVERGRRLVADQHLGIARQAGGEGDPLPHAARELERVLLRDAERQVDLVERRAISSRPRRGRSSAAAICDAAAVHRAEAGEGVLQQQADATSAEAVSADGPSARSTSVSPSRTVPVAVTPRGSRPMIALAVIDLPRPGLADERDGLVRTDREVHVGDDRSGRTGDSQVVQLRVRRSSLRLPQR